MALTPPALDRDRFCTVEQVREDASGQALVRFSGIHGIGPAQAIAGCYVLAAEDDLDLGPLDMADDDLFDREVVDERYGSLGRITEIIETPANDVWCVEGGPYGEVLIPVVEEAVEWIPFEGPIETHIMDGLIGLNGGPTAEGQDIEPDFSYFDDGCEYGYDEEDGDAEAGEDAASEDAPEPAPAGDAATAGEGEGA